MVSITRFIFVLLLAICFLVFCWRSTNLERRNPNYRNHCYIEPWNDVHTSYATNSLWNAFSQWLWITLDLSNENLHNNTEMSLLAAYVYPDHISISLYSQHMARQRIYCRYYDCDQQEIADSEFLGVVFPESVVHCPRRKGAEFVSVSKALQDEVPTPVRLTFRVYKEPVHELSVCVATIYGNQPIWLPIVDFIEHNKLEGASYFYFYIGQISKYDEKLLTDYVRTGDIETVKLQDKYHRVFIAWQFLQIQDCHLRSKYHSRWTAFIDLDERLSANGQRMIDILRSIQDATIGEVQMQSLSVIKDQDYPMKYHNLTQLENEFIFKKYNKTIGPSWIGQKSIIRSDKIGVMSVHAAVARYPGIRAHSLNSNTAVIRHLRSTKYRVFGSDWHKTPDENGQLPVPEETPLPEVFSRKMRKAITKRVLHVYETVPVDCRTIPTKLRLMIRHPDPCEQQWEEF